MSLKEKHEKAVALIESYRPHNEDTSDLLVECVLMAANEDDYQIAIIALYKYVIEDVR